MEVQCHFCGHTQSVEDLNFGAADKVEVTCPACRKAFPVVSPKLDSLRLESTRQKVAAISSEVNPEGLVLQLPADRELRLQVLEGAEEGTVYPVNKSRITIGRANSDVIIRDKLSSRVHCAVEVGENWVLLRDLDSTNGTLMNGKPIHTAPLADGSTFRVGDHLFKLMIAPKDK